MQHLPLIERAVKHGERVAFQTPDRECTYSHLVSGSSQLASRLLDGERDLREARVAYITSAGDKYATTQWGIWLAGGIAVPLSRSAAESELDYALADSQATTVVASRELMGRVEGICRRRDVRLLLLEETGISEASGRGATVRDAALPKLTPDRRAMIVYTSGTTSRPKGVVTTHASIQAQIEALIEAWRWQADDCIPLFLPLHHVHGIINVMSCALWAGARIEPFEGFTLDPILQRVADGAYTVFMAVPTIYVKLIESLETLDEPMRTAVVEGFRRMRLMVSGSAALPASVHQQWSQLTGQQLLERYGMTEIGMALSNPYDGERRPGAVGLPLPGVEVRLRSDAGENIREESVSGEIQVRGPAVFREYWARPDATRESFVDGWFRTGDVAVVENGYYRIMGRNSVDIIKSGGYKLSALEIEASLLDHPSIGQCAVVGIPNDKWGETVAVAVVFKPGCSLDLDGLQAWCEGRMSTYKIPRKLLVVDELPRNAMGKVTKPAVTKLFDG